MLHAHRSSKGSSIGPNREEASAPALIGLWLPTPCDAHHKHPRPDNQANKKGEQDNDTSFTQWACLIRLKSKRPLSVHQHIRQAYKPVYFVPLWERAQSSHSDNGTPSAVTGQSGDIHNPQSCAHLRAVIAPRELTPSCRRPHNTHAMPTAQLVTICHRFSNSLFLALPIKGDSAKYVPYWCSKNVIYFLSIFLGHQIMLETISKNP